MEFKKVNIALFGLINKIKSIKFFSFSPKLKHIIIFTFLLNYGLLNSQTTITNLTGTWIGAKKGFNLSCNYNNYLFHSDCGDNDSLYRIDLNTGFDTVLCRLPFSSYLRISPLNGPNFLLSGSTLVGNELYILNNDNSFRKVNLSTLTWTNLSSHTSSFFLGKKGITTDGSNYIYVWGGRTNIAQGPNGAGNDLEHSDELWRYSISTNTWYLLSKAPVRLLCQDATFSYPYIYFGSGGQWGAWGGFNHNRVYQYNLITNSWSNFSTPYSIQSYYSCLIANYFLYKNKYYTYGRLWDNNIGCTSSKLYYRDFNTQTWIEDTIISEQQLNFLKVQVPDQNSGRMHFNAIPQGSNMIFVNDYSYSGSNFVNSGYRHISTISPKRIVIVDIDSSDCYNGEDSVVVHAKFFLNGTFVNNVLNIKLLSPSNNITNLETINNLYSSTAQTLYRTFKFHKKQLGHRLFCEYISSNDTLLSFNKFTIKNSIRYAIADSLMASSTTDFCVGQPIGVQLYLSTKNNRKYLWYYNNGVIPNQTTNTYTATSLGAYKVKITSNINGCSSYTNNINLKYISNAQIYLVGNKNPCTGDTARLNAIYNSSYIYQWKKNGIDIPGANLFYLNVTSAGLYSVFIKYNSSCSSLSNSLNIKFNKKQNVIISHPGSSKICKNQQLTLTADSGSIFQWYKELSVIPNSKNKQIIINDSGNYNIEVTTDSGCVSISNTIHISQVVINTQIDNNNDTICLGNYILFKSSTFLINDSIKKIEWIDSDGQKNYSSKYLKKFANQGKNYIKLKVISGQGCSDSITSQIYVLKKVTAGIILGQFSNLKLNQTYNYIVSQQISVKYEWVVDNGVLLSGQGTNSANIQWAKNGPGKLKSIIENSSGCADTSTVLVGIGITPNIIFFNPIKGFTNDTIVIVGNNFIGVDSVYFGKTKAKFYNVINSTVIKAVVDTGSSGNVRVVTSIGPCVRSGFIYGNTNEIDGLDLNAKFSFYPNPVSDILKIYSDKPCHVKIFNILGKEYTDVLIVNRLNEIDVSGWEKGVYLLIVSDRQNVPLKSHKIVIQ